MDSAVAAALAAREGYEIVALHFNYSQRTEKKELSCFRSLASHLKAVDSYEINLPFFGDIGASALTDRSIDVPTSGLADGIPVTYVPFRNGIFLSIAAAVAEKDGADMLVIGAVEEDSSGYPDCTQRFLDSFESTVRLGTKHGNLKVHAPLLHKNKSQIVSLALEYGVPLEYTWSCYQNEQRACGVCDSCILRLRGFEAAGVKDPIEYAS